MQIFLAKKTVYWFSHYHSSNTIIKFADDIIVVVFITGGDKSALRDNVQRVSLLSSIKNLSLNSH